LPEGKVHCFGRLSPPQLKRFKSAPPLKLYGVIMMLETEKSTMLELIDAFRKEVVECTEPIDLVKAWEKVGNYLVVIIYGKEPVP